MIALALLAFLSLCMISLVPASATRNIYAAASALLATHNYPADLWSYSSHSAKSPGDHLGATQARVHRASQERRMVAGVAAGVHGPLHGRLVARTQLSSSAAAACRA
jgi:hypothetical protein